MSGPAGCCTGWVPTPGLRTRNSVADIAGNYPSKNASGERGAWFRDSEGNMIGVGRLVR